MNNFHIKRLFYDWVLFAFLKTNKKKEQSHTPNYILLYFVEYKMTVSCSVFTRIWCSIFSFNSIPNEMSSDVFFYLKTLVSLPTEWQILFFVFTSLFKINDCFLGFKNDRIFQLTITAEASIKDTPTAWINNTWKISDKFQAIKPIHNENELKWTQQSCDLATFLLRLAFLFNLNKIAISQNANVKYTPA